MDTLNPEYRNNSDSSQAKASGSVGFLNFFKALQNGAEQQAVVGLETPLAIAPFHEPAPIYKGSYAKLSPLAFNTLPVDNAANSKLNPQTLGEYNRAQLFFLLRLERFLRLRKYWLDAMPRTDEAWKTSLALRGIFSAMRDCREHGVGEVAMQLLKDWECC